MKWFVITPDQRTPLAPGAVLVLGRDPQCDIVIAHSDRVSRRHLEIQLSDDMETWTVRDVSSNGSATAAGRFTTGSGVVGFVSRDELSGDVISGWARVPGRCPCAVVHCGGAVRRDVVHVHRPGIDGCGLVCCVVGVECGDANCRPVDRGHRRA